MAIRWRHRAAAAVGGSAAALAGRLYEHLPATVSRPLVTAAGDLGWVLLGARRRTLTGNVRWLVPHAPPADRRRVARATFRNFARCAADVLALQHAGERRILDLIRISGRHHLDRALAGGRGVLLVAGHLGNWELGGLALAALGYPSHALIESISPERDALFARFRTHSGLQLLPATARPSRMLRVLESGSVLAVVADRAVGRTPGEIVGFASGHRAVPRGPAWLALRSGAPVLPVRVVLTSRRFQPYDGVIDPPLVIDPARPDVDVLTRTIAAHLGALAAQYPDQWFVFDPQWQDPPE
jgi:lauroyl/myristoyl acyltransferase